MDGESTLHLLENLHMWFSYKNMYYIDIVAHYLHQGEYIMFTHVNIPMEEIHFNYSIAPNSTFRQISWTKNE